LCSQNVSLNKQHKIVVPESFQRTGKEGLRSMVRFFRNYACNLNDNKTICGVRTVEAYLVHIGRKFTTQELTRDSDHWRNRRLVFFRVLLSSLLEVGTFFRRGGGTNFLIHLVMADLESKFPDLCGKVTIDSVFMGSGSLCGIRLCTRHKAGETLVTRLRWFHGELIKQLLSLSKLELAMMGYKVVGGKLFSIFSHRIYSYIDTEHILCKVYVLLTISYPSRTISDTPRCSSTFTWPIAAGCNYWTEDFRSEMQRYVLDSYERILQKGGPKDWREILLDSYPVQLTYDYDDCIRPKMPPLVKRACSSHETEVQPVLIVPV
jgi:hypothetical protein